MLEREAKLLFKSNDLDNITIQFAPNQKGWLVFIIEKNGQQHNLVSKRDTDSRVFKTSDAALRACLRIGFKEVDVIM